MPGGNYGGFIVMSGGNYGGKMQKGEFEGSKRIEQNRSLFTMIDET